MNRLSKAILTGSRINTGFLASFFTMGSFPFSHHSGEPPLPSRDHHFCDGRDFSCPRFCAAAVLPGSEEAWTRIAFQSQAFSFALQLAFTAGIPFVTPTPAAGCRSRAAWGTFYQAKGQQTKATAQPRGGFYLEDTPGLSGRAKPASRLRQGRGSR